MDREERNAIIDRCLEIQDEYLTLDTPMPSFMIDDDEEYQENLELSWHRQELEDEYEALNHRLGVRKPSLREYAKSPSFNDRLIQTLRA